MAVVNRQMLLASFVCELKLLRTLWRERSTLRSIVDSGNYRFLQFALPGHFYSPIPDIEAQAKSHLKLDPSPKEIPGINLCVEQQLELVREFATFYKEIPFPEKRQDGFRYYLDNGYFSYGDGVVLYSMMRRFKPKRIIEVGSGFSSAAMLDVNDRFLDAKVNFTFIEPSPDRLLSLLGNQDKERWHLLKEPVQEVPDELFASLHENDILFVDSSHVAKAHSDVVHVFFRILPLLNKGVIIHFHDIAWPFEYPYSWFYQGRAWNEAYILRAFLQYNSAFRIIYFNSMMEIQHGQFLRRELPLAMKTPSSLLTPGNMSFWIRKTQ
jgi:predicted O-methyltransferase YrrM